MQKKKKKIKSKIIFIFPLNKLFVLKTHRILNLIYISTLPVYLNFKKKRFKTSSCCNYSRNTIGIIYGGHRVTQSCVCLGPAFTSIALIVSLIKHPIHTVSSDAWPQVHGFSLSLPVSVSSCLTLMLVSHETSPKQSPSVQCSICPIFLCATIVPITHLKRAQWSMFLSQ